MFGLDSLLVAAVIYGSGFFTRYFTEPEKVCKDLIYEIPEDLMKPYEPTMCTRGTDKLGIKRECYVNEDPVYMLLPRYRKGLDSFIIKLQLNLFECNNLLVEYRKEKYIER